MEASWRLVTPDKNGLCLENIASVEVEVYKGFVGTEQFLCVLGNGSLEVGSGA